MLEEEALIHPNMSWEWLPGAVTGSAKNRPAIQQAQDPTGALHLTLLYKGSLITNPTTCLSLQKTKAHFVAQGSMAYTAREFVV